MATDSTNTLNIHRRNHPLYPVPKERQDKAPAIVEFGVAFRSLNKAHAAIAATTTKTDREEAIRHCRYRMAALTTFTSDLIRQDPDFAADLFNLTTAADWADLRKLATPTGKGRVKTMRAKLARNATKVAARRRTELRAAA